MFLFSKKSLLTIVLLVSGACFGYTSGKMDCYFEIVSKTNWPKVEKQPVFTIDLMQYYENSIESKWLENKIRLQYVPGKVSAQDVQFGAVSMTYDNANSGADFSLMPNGIYIFRIGRQDSDLVGGFMNCQITDLK